MQRFMIAVDTIVAPENSEESLYAAVACRDTEHPMQGAIQASSTWGPSHHLSLPACAQHSQTSKEIEQNKDLAIASLIKQSSTKQSTSTENWGMQSFQATAHKATQSNAKPKSKAAR